MTISPQSDLLRFACDADGIATITLRDTENKNAFSLALVRELRSALLQAHQPSVKVCILQSALPEVFSSGGNQKILKDLATGRIAPYDLDLTADLLAVPVPTIAAMKGHAVGGGFVLGLCCDLVVLGEKSRYSCNFMDLGFTPGMGATHLIQDALGEHFAAEMLFATPYLRGSQFVGRSHINYVLPAAKVDAKVADIAARIAEKPEAALRLLKRSLVLHRKQRFETARTMESMMHELCFRQPEVATKIRERFVGGGDED